MANKNPWQARYEDYEKKKKEVTVRQRDLANEEVVAGIKNPRWGGTYSIPGRNLFPPVAQATANLSGNSGGEVTGARLSAQANAYNQPFSNAAYSQRLRGQARATVPTSGGRTPSEQAYMARMYVQAFGTPGWEGYGMDTMEWLSKFGPHGRTIWMTNNPVGTPNLAESPNYDWYGGSGGGGGGGYGGFYNPFLGLTNWRI